MIILILASIFLGIYAIMVVEHWSIYKSWDFVYPFSIFTGYFIQEDLEPRKRDESFMRQPLFFSWWLVYWQ